MRRSVPWLLALALLAGCAGGGDGDAGPADPTPTATGGPPAPAPVAPSAPAATPVPFSWSGHTKEGTWVCMEQSGLGQCPAGQQVAPDGQHVTSLAYAGNLSAIELSMTWQADPTQTGLVLAVYGNQTGRLALLAATHGDSPLALRVETAASSLAADGALVLMVWPEGKTATSPSVFVDATQQAFTVEGTLWQSG